MKRIVSMFLAAAVVCGMALSPSGAAETKPIAAVAVASYNDLLGDVNFVGKLVDRPDLGIALEGAAAWFTQGKGLAGIDKTRPWGLIIQASGETDFSGYAFVPVTDFKAALGLLETLFDKVEAEGDVYKLTPKDGDKVSYVKQHGTWACFAEKPEMLAHCDADPTALLGHLEKRSIVSGHVFLANVPEGLREKFLSQLKEGLLKDAAQHGDESNAEYAGRKKFIDQLESYLPRVFGELDQVVLAWGLDRTTEKTFIDVSVTAKSGTKTAEEMGLAGKVTTNFAGFRLPGAAVTALWGGPMPPAKQELAASLIEAVRGKALADAEKKPADKRAVAKEVVNDAADLLQKIIKSGHADGAAAVLVSPKAATALLAGYVADGTLLDKILHVIAKTVLAEHPELAQFVKLDAEKSGSVTFHKISIPIPQDAKDRQKVVQLIGEKLDVVIGVGPENAYLAVGRNAPATLKKAIDGSAKAGAKPVAPLEVSLAVKPVMGFAAVMGEPKDRPNAAMIESELKKTPGKDHVTLTVRPISNGVQIHLEVEQGLVRLVGHLATMGMEQKTEAGAK
jgi:hypothetical protein